MTGRRGQRQSESSPLVLPKIHLSLSLPLSTSFPNSLVAPYGPDSFVARLFSRPPLDASPQALGPSPSTQAISVPPRTLGPAYITSLTKSNFTTYCMYSPCGVSGRAAQRITNPTSGHFLFSFFISESRLLLRSLACAYVLTCFVLTSSPLLAQPHLLSFLSPADFSRSAAPKPMGVKADEWMPTTSASLVDACNSHSRRGDISTYHHSPLSPNSLGGVCHELS